MIPKITVPGAKDIFQKMPEIEVEHQDRIFSEYDKITGSSDSREVFEKGVAGDVVEGGLTTGSWIEFIDISRLSLR